MVNRKKIGAVMVVCVMAMVTTACGKSVTITPGKEITLSDEEKKKANDLGNILIDAYNDAVGRDDGEMGNTTFGKVTISVTCPQGWKVYAEAKESLWAAHNSYPKYELQVEEDTIETKNYNDVTSRYIKKYKKLNAKNIKKAEKELKKDYVWNLKRREISKWKNVVFGSKKLNAQYYITVKGRSKPKSKNHMGNGFYRYITICNGKLFRFTFTTNNPDIDESVMSIFDSIMKTVTYE